MKTYILSKQKVCIVLARSKKKKNIYLRLEEMLQYRKPTWNTNNHL